MTLNNVNVVSVEDKLAELEKQGKTVMLLAVDGQIAGIVAVMDTLKDSAAEAVKQLKGMGLKVAMLTGDNERAAKAIAKQLGIDTVIADVLPWGKVNVVKNCRVKAKWLPWSATGSMMSQPLLKHV